MVLKSLSSVRSLLAMEHHCLVLHTLRSLAQLQSLTRCHNELFLTFNVYHPCIYQNYKLYHLMMKSEASFNLNLVHSLLLWISYKTQNIIYLLQKFARKLNTRIFFLSWGFWTVSYFHNHYLVFSHDLLLDVPDNLSL